VGVRSKPVKVVEPRYTVEFVRQVFHAFELCIQLWRLEDRVGKEIIHIAVQEIGQDDIIEGEGWRATAVEVKHGYVKPARGFKFETNGLMVVISGDTRPSEQLIGRRKGLMRWVHELMVASPERGTKLGPASKSLTVFQRRIADSHTCVRKVGTIASVLVPDS